MSFPIAHIGADSEAPPVWVQLIVTSWRKSGKVETIIRQNAKREAADFERVFCEAESVMLRDDYESHNISNIKPLVPKELDFRIII
jgi:hypothetical protein